MNMPTDHDTLEIVSSEGLERELTLVRAASGAPSLHAGVRKALLACTASEPRCGPGRRLLDRIGVKLDRAVCTL
jgi:hypothetical protein